MTLLIAFLLIHMDGGGFLWYAGATLLWAGHLSYHESKKK